MVHADGFGVFENLFCTGSTDGQCGDFSACGFLVLEGDFDGKFVVGAHHHFDAGKVNTVAVDDDLRIGVGHLLDENDDGGHEH